MIKISIAKAVILFSLLVLIPLFIDADEIEEVQNIPLESLNVILDSEDFGEHKTIPAIRLKNNNPKNAPALDTASWMDTARKIAALCIRAIAVAVIVGLIFVMIVFLRRLTTKLQNRKKACKLDFVKQQKITPSELIQNAYTCYKKGDIRGAWAFCFSAMLSIYSERGIDFKMDTTEYECIYIADKELGSENEIFKQIIQNWILIAYAHKNPNICEFEKAAAFCQSLINRKVDL